MSFGVIFLLTHPQHAARLVVAIFNLRKYYSGPITVFTTRTDGQTFIERLLAEPRLNVSVIATQEAEAGSNSAYVTKPRLLTQSPYDATLFMDADTLVAGDISRLIEMTQQKSLVVTGFCNMTTMHPMMLQRFESWLPLINIPGDRFNLEQLIPLSMQNPLPVINVGIFGFHRGAESLSLWRELSDFGEKAVLPDEMSLQILLPIVNHYFMSTQYNCAPLFMPDAVGVRIWHFVGTSHLLNERSREIWRIAYDECHRERVAEIDLWSRFEPSDTPPPIESPFPIT